MTKQVKVGQSLHRWPSKHSSSVLGSPRLVRVGARGLAGVRHGSIGHDWSTAVNTINIDTKCHLNFNNLVLILLFS